MTPNPTFYLLITLHWTVEFKPAVSVVLVLDKSGSMGEFVHKLPDTTTRFDVIKRAAKGFIHNLKFIPPSAVAVVSFDALPYIEQYFTNDKSALFRAVDSIKLGGDTRYNDPLLDSVRGAIPMLSRRPMLPVKRIVVFVTDGEPNKLYPLSKDSIYNGLRSTNITFYGIAAWAETNSAVAEFARSTGGKAYSVASGDVESRLNEFFQQIAAFTQSREHCSIDWPAQPSCTGVSTVEITLKKGAMQALTDAKSYPAPGAVFSVSAAPAAVQFGAAPPGRTARRQITLTPNYDLTLVKGEIRNATGKFALAADGPNGWDGATAITIPANTPRIFEVEFTQEQQQTPRTAVLSFTGTPCNPPDIPLAAEAPSGIDDPSAAGFAVLPNPAAETAEAVFNLAAPVPVRLELAAPDGRIVLAVAAEGVAGENYLRIPLAGVAAGVYAARLRYDGQTAVQRIAVMR
jgi:hypothetical protein